MSKGIDGNEGIVELPENVTSQDVEVDGNKFNTIPKGHQNANVNPNDHITSRNQETEVPENSVEKGGNTEPTNTQFQDESPSLEPNSESSTIDDIPNIESHLAWISRTVYNTDTHRNYFMDEAVQHVDPQIKGIAGETVHDISEISSISQENVYNIGSEMHDSVVKTALNSDSEIGAIFEDTVQSTDSEIGGVLEDTVQSINAEFGGILGDASDLLQQPFPLYSAELSNNNTLETSDNNAVSHILTDSAANLVENDVTQMFKSLTVNAKTDMESASCILQELVPDMTVDHTTENNSDVHLLNSSFPHTPIIIPSKSEEGETLQITFTCFLLSRIVYL